MIVQLPNGRIVECSVEQYLSLTDDEIKDLNGLGVVYTKEVGDPFYNKFSNPYPIVNDFDNDDEDIIVEDSRTLDEIEDQEKRDDSYFHKDDV
jgi:hypothetical protein|tara:strand:+ start:409 stop:687 length:279 start_codon:yes stop_codon:yes gene_type:complete